MIADQRNYGRNTDIYDLPEASNADEFWSNLERGQRDIPYLAASISNAIKFIQKHPFPDVLNRTFNFLKDVFLKTDSNLIRYRIVVLARECRPFIHAYQTSELMLRTMMQISHNQDPEARSCSLLLVAAMAPIMSSETHAHHLILEGLNSADKSERGSAISAAVEFAKFSISFCDIAIEKFDTMVSSTYIDESIKIRVLRAMAYFKDSVTCCDRIDDVCRRLLRRNDSKSTVGAVYGLLTVVAKKRSHVFEHVNFLLDELETNSDDLFFTTCLMSNLAQVSNSSQWTIEQLERLLKFAPSIIGQKSPKPIRKFLISLFNLANEKIFQSFIAKRMDFLTLLMAHEDFEAAVLAAKVSIKLCSSEELTTSNTFLIHLLPSLLTRMISAPKKLQKSLLKVTVDYCNGLFVDDEQVISIVTHLMNLTTTEYSCYNLVLESLNAICSIFPKVYPTAIEFAWNILLGKFERFNEDFDMESKIQPVFKPSNLLISLILAPNFVRGENAPNLEDFVKNFALKTNFRQQYDIAIQGFRYGHWKNVSLPLLQNIPNGQLSTISSCWLNSLKHISSSKPNEINVQHLSKATFQLSTASIDLESLCPNTEKSLSFQFPSLYTTIFSKITFILKCFFTFLNGNQGFLLAETDYAKYAVVTQCDLMLRDCDKISPLIEELARFSFDADSESRTQVSLLQQFHDLIGYCFSYLSALPFKELPTPYAVTTENPMNSQMRDVIAWSRSQLAKMDHSKWQDRVNLANTMLISDVLKELYQSFFYLPRAFFQLIHSTKIRLNVKVASLSKDMSNAYVVSQVHKILPVDVEGFVETNNPAGIQFVNVKAVVTPEKGFSEMPLPPPTIHQKSVELNNEDSRFLAHFGFNLSNTSRVTIKFSVTFVDKKSRKVWQSGAETEITVKIGRQD